MEAFVVYSELTVDVPDELRDYVFGAIGRVFEEIGTRREEVVPGLLYAPSAGCVGVESGIEESGPKVLRQSTVFRDLQSWGAFMREMHTGLVYVIEPQWILSTGSVNWKIEGELVQRLLSDKLSHDDKVWLLETGGQLLRKKLPVA